MTVGTFLTRWLEDSARPTIKELTYDSYEVSIRVHINPHIGSVKLAKLSPAHVQGMYAAMERDGKSGHVRLLCHAVLRRALKQAVRWQLVPRNVCDAVDPPKAPKREIQPFTAAESQKLLIEARGERLEALYVLAIMGGFRQGELLALKWEDIDMVAGTVMVRRTLRIKRGRVIVTPPKSSKGKRLVEMPQMAMDVLQDHRKRMMAEGHAGCEWVFCNTVGTPIDKNNLVRRSYKPLLKRAGVPERRFHDLRHTHATLMLLQGEHPKVVQERMGHATIGMTLDTYSHVMPGMQRGAADRLGDLFSTAIA
jgi:integrase